MDPRPLSDRNFGQTLVSAWGPDLLARLIKECTAINAKPQEIAALTLPPDPAFRTSEALTAIIEADSSCFPSLLCITDPSELALMRWTANERRAKGAGLFIAVIIPKVGWAVRYKTYQELKRISAVFQPAEDEELKADEMLLANMVEYRTEQHGLMTTCALDDGSVPSILKCLDEGSGRCMFGECTMKMEFAQTNYFVYSGSFGGFASYLMLSKFWTRRTKSAITGLLTVAGGSTLASWWDELSVEERKRLCPWFSSTKNGESLLQELRSEALGSSSQLALLMENARSDHVAAQLVQEETDERERNQKSKSSNKNKRKKKNSEKRKQSNMQFDPDPQPQQHQEQQQEQNEMRPETKSSPSSVESTEALASVEQEELVSNNDKLTLSPPHGAIEEESESISSNVNEVLTSKTHAEQVDKVDFNNNPSSMPTQEQSQASAPVVHPLIEQAREHEVRTRRGSSSDFSFGTMSDLDDGFMPGSSIEDADIMSADTWEQAKKKSRKKREKRRLASLASSVTLSSTLSAETTNQPTSEGATQQKSVITGSSASVETASAIQMKEIQVSNGKVVQMEQPLILNSNNNNNSSVKVNTNNIQDGPVSSSLSSPPADVLSVASAASSSLTPPQRPLSTVSSPGKQSVQSSASTRVKGMAPLVLSREGSKSPSSRATSSRLVSPPASGSPSLLTVAQSLGRPAVIPLSTVVSLHSDIREMAAALEMVATRRQPWQLAVAERVKQVVYSVWPRAWCDVFGSIASGLAAPCSDVDMVVRGVPQQDRVRLLAQSLEGQEWVQMLQAVERTAVPVVKFKTAAIPIAFGNRGNLIAVDITFENEAHHGLNTCGIVRHFAQRWPVLKPLVLVLKQFLVEKGLNDPYVGGLSSYGLVLMVAAILRRRWPVGMVQQGQATVSSSPDLGSLFIEFLEVYSSRDFLENGVRLSNDRGRKPVGDPCYIEDPLDPNNNVGRACFGIRQVMEEFGRALEAIRSYDRQHQQESNKKSIPTSVLGRVFATSHHSDVVNLVTKVWCPPEMPSNRSNGDESVSRPRFFLPSPHSISSPHDALGNHSVSVSTLQRLSALEKWAAEARQALMQAARAAETSGSNGECPMCGQQMGSSHVTSKCELSNLAKRCPL